MKVFSIALVLAVLSAGCGGDNPTAPATTPPAPATVTETFSGTVQVGGASFYSFVVPASGTVNVTLTSVGGTDVPATAPLGIAIGTPAGTGCSGGTVTTTPSGTDVQLTGTYSAGRYCVNVSDVGNLAAPAAFIVTIAHP